MPCASGPTPHWRLVPFDNNIGQRNVAPMPGGGRTVALLAAFADREFFVDNMSEKAATVRIDLVLPAFLRRLGWRASIASVEGTTIQLKPGAQRQLRLALKAGKDFTEEDVRQAKDDVRIRVRRSEEHTSELQSQSNLVCRLLLEKKKKKKQKMKSMI